MSEFQNIFKTKNVRQIWKALRDGIVPIVSTENYSRISEHVKKLVLDLDTRNYMPSIGHGYLGYPKANGCTRFVPILTKEDMTVYYMLILSIQEHILFNIKGVYGAWRSVPKPISEGFDDDDIDNIVDPYFSGTLSRREWFKQWSSFNDLLIELSAQRDIGNFVIISDIANFYDTIDINILCTKINSAVPGNEQIVSYLRMFLGNWDRRTKGYTASSKGIPQEILTDASRTLANFYIKDFDIEFKEYCDSNGMTYVRWADDIMVFGRSRMQLERAIHCGCRMLLKFGLNLNASKTRHFSRREFFMYKGLGVLSAIKSRDPNAFERELRKFHNWSGRNVARTDTVYRAAVGFMFEKKEARTPFAEFFIEDHSDKFDYLGSLFHIQLHKRIFLSENPLRCMERVLSLILTYPYAAPRAEFLKMLSKYYWKFERAGMSKRKLVNRVKRVETNNADSEIVKEICAPAARRKI